MCEPVAIKLHDAFSDLNVEYSESGQSLSAIIAVTQERGQYQTDRRGWQLSIK